MKTFQEFVSQQEGILDFANRAAAGAVGGTLGAARGFNNVFMWPYKTAAGAYHGAVNAATSNTPWKATIGLGQEQWYTKIRSGLKNLAYEMEAFAGFHAKNSPRLQSLLEKYAENLEKMLAHFDKHTKSLVDIGDGALDYHKGIHFVKDTVGKFLN